MDYEPRFMIGDLATYHILFNRQTRMGSRFSSLEPYLYTDSRVHCQGSFSAGALELDWVLRDIQRGENELIVVHIGRSRDMLPVDAAW